MVKLLQTLELDFHFRAYLFFFLALSVICIRRFESDIMITQTAVMDKNVTESTSS